MQRARQSSVESPRSRRSDSIGSARQSLLLSPSLSLRRLDDSTWEERAVCYFFDQYTTRDQSDECLSHLGFLPSLYAVCRDGGPGGPVSSCLQWAVGATALVTLSNQVKAPSLMLQARNRYGMALRGLRQALGSREQAVKDETFSTMVLLSLFEDISGDRKGLASSHTAGFGLLMKLRGESQLGHAQGRDLFSFAYAHTHIEILVLGERPRYNTDWILEQLNKSDPIHGLMLIASKLSQLALETSSISKPLDPDLLCRVFEWHDAGRAMDTELTQWSEALPEQWLPLVVDAQTQTDEPLLTYRRISIAGIWIYYWAIRLIVQKLMIELSRTLASATGDSALLQGEQEALGICHEMISATCRSIPFAFGHIDMQGNPIPPPPEGKPRIRGFLGYIMLWPLWYILSCGMATPAQTEQIRSALGQVGSALGIRLALMLAQEGDTPTTAPSIPDLHQFVPVMGQFSQM
ncbi:hypothetical protein P168DRAFT_47693 [Aspergillus campestris IBT 28561]|uniref:Zn(II)2Cys6 transcription factor n=1 Tax=Aspergillus campestris (strain IBT 28561) TaxID=1392248 RepID=A0A2I1CUU5_ASPC2|nr:uncharacterized protein P168DRAFT_47693 [Aspergillus campestris IBT 28561]PKY01389.1 hypothetical protein P168DRAFT_47693 [Aspergillus campestris IBT 28561]